MGRLLLGGLLLSVVLSAAHVSGADDAKLAAPSADQIDARVKQLEETKDIDEKVKKKALELYEKAKKELSLAERWEGKKQAYDASVKEASKAIAEAKRELELLAVGSEPDIGPSVTLGQLNQMLDEAESKVKRLESELGEAKSELRTRKQRRAEMPRLIRDAKQRLAEVRVQLDSKATAEEAEVVQNARNELLQASVLTLRNKVAAYESETEAYEATSPLVPLRCELAAARLDTAKKAVTTLREAARARRRLEIVGQLSQARRDLESALPAVRAMATRSADLTAERSSLNEKMEKTVDDRLEAEQKLAKVSSLQERVQEQIDLGGASFVGALVRWRSDLPDVREYRKRIARRGKEIARVRFDLYTLEEEQESLGNMDAVVRRLTEGLDMTDPAQAEQYDLLIRYAGGMKKRYLEQLVREYDDYYVELIELRGVEQQLVAETNEFRQLIDERILWVRTSLPPDFDTVRSAGEAAAWLGSASTWRDVAVTFDVDDVARPLVWLVAATVFLPLVVLRSRIRRAVVQIGDYAAKGGTQRFWPTGEVLALTVLLAVLWPGLLWFVGFTIASSEQAVAGAKAIAHGLAVVALVSLPIEFLRQVCRPAGLAEIHFGWPVNSVAQLRKRLGCFIMVGCPWLFVSATFRELDKESWNGSLGRLSFVALLIVAIVFAHRVLRPSGTVVREFLAQRSDGWLAKTRWLWYLLGVLSPALLIGLALMGYYYAAWHFAARLLATAWLLVGLVLLGALLLRWVLMIRRRLAIAQAVQRREAAQAASDEANAAAGEETPIEASTAESEVDLARLNLQTRRLVYGSLAAACVLGICVIWADVLPAFNVLRGVTLWHTVVTVGQDTGMMDGESVIRAVEQYEPVTLADLIVASIGVVVTFVLARNFPGLLEFLLLQHLPMDSGLRHALTTVSRYLIVLIGVFFFFSTLGISWSKVQWLVAGISVGLGFGLQEIFANFVSGLVILFERPVRLGDVITIGDATGKVSRIQIRATTITDWDRKELVVPNKEFITGRLLNWTLTNKTNRITLNVGVAYGSDPDRVREILLEIAQEHPKVLESPTPIAICNDFGANALNFSLRVYLESMVGRLGVIHDLHAAIHNRFRREGITIAFPQLDLHVRSFGPSEVSVPPEVEAPELFTSGEGATEPAPPSSKPPEVNPDTAEER